MKKTFSIIFFVLSVTLFAQNSKKDIYIKQHLPLLKENLTKKEYNQFKKSMRFDKKDHLIAQNFNLLEKGAGDQFGVYFQYIATQRSGRVETIGLSRSDGTEIIISPDGTIISKTKVSTKEVANSQIEGGTIKSYTNKSYTLSDLLTEDGLFIITSTSCGPCISAYPTLNELTQNTSLSKIKFVALYRDSFQKINTFKEGSMFNKFGELKEPWIIFSSDELIQKYNSKYDFKGVPYVFIKNNGKIVYQSYAIKIDEIKKQLLDIERQQP